MAKKKNSDVDLVSISVKDSSTKTEIETAFLNNYSMPQVESLDEEGKTVYSPMFTSGEDFVEYHVRNFIRNVVREYREKVAIQVAKQSAQVDIFE